MARLIAERFRQDAWIFGVIILYSFVVFSFSLYLHKPQKLIIISYMIQWVRITLFILNFLALRALIFSWRSENTISDFLKKLKQWISPGNVCGIGVYLALGLFLGAFTEAKTLMEVISPFSWDNSLAQFDAILHGGDTYKLVPMVHNLTRILQFIYIPIWLIFLISVNFYISLFANEKLRRQYFITYFVNWIFLGNIVALLFLSGGPIYSLALTGSPRFQPLVDYLQFSKGLPFSSVDVADLLWAAHMTGNSAEGSGISAFPSLHLAMATLWGLTLTRILPWIRWPMVAFVAIIEIGSVHLGWHYAIDGYFSIIVTLLIWKLAGVSSPVRSAGLTAY